MVILETRGFANDDLDDFLELFPDRAHAQQVKQRRQDAMTATQPTTL